MGHVRSRLLAHLPANLPVRLQKTQPKSFVKRILPLSPTLSRFCAAKPRIFMKTRNFGVGGRGVPPPQSLPNRETTLTAPAGAPAAHAAVATAVAGHDGAADGATGGVAHVD